MYSFDLTDEQKMLTDAVHRYATRQLRAIYRDAEEAGALPADVIQTGWELGLLPALLPDAFGGYGEHSALNGALIVEALGYGDVAAALHLLSPNLVAIPILLCGTPQQKQTYLPQFCTETFPKATAAFLEATVAFDPYDLHTSARLVDDRYVLWGQKTMVINADEAETLLVYAREDETGTTQAFLVPARDPRIHINRRERWMGFHALKTFTVDLAGVTIPAANKLGGEAGIDLKAILTCSRIAVAGLGVGLAKAAFEYARDYAKARVAFGEPIAHRQAIAFLLADMAIEIDATRLLVWEAAWKFDQGKPAVHDAYLAAHYAADMALKVTDGAVQVLGGHGYIRDHPVELWLRNGRGLATLVGSVII